MKMRSKPRTIFTLFVSFSIFMFALTNSGIISADDSLPGSNPTSLEVYTETPTPENPSGESNATDTGETPLPESTADSGLESTQPGNPEITESQTPSSISTETPAAISETPGVIQTETPMETPTETPTAALTETLTPTASATPDESMQWSLQIDAISKSVYSQASALTSDFLSQGLDSELSAQGGGLYSMTINGEDGVQEIRDVLYGELGDAVRFIGGSAEITIEMPLESTQEISIALESNPSTGYEWQIVQAESEGAGMSGDSAYLGRGGIGAPDMVTLTLKPAQIGSATIRLVYKRPFEPEPQITRHLTIRFSQSVNQIDLSDPNPPAAVGAEEALTAMGATEETLSAQAELPAAFDWRVGDATHPAINIPIRNQGSCGSCWAFGTVGVMEGAMVKAGMPVTDLSEQFLVSCNKDGWDCDGGWIAHKYHTNTLGKSQSVIGAVLESDMPYTATDGGCYNVSNHPYKLSSYASTSGASVSAIKNAIYTYGPVLATVCSGPAFHAYYSWYTSDLGVFSTNESSQCGSDGVNHVIVLVGWNDAGGYWILRNSWDTWWGEDGYMRIAYGTSKVAKYISWATYTTPLAPAPLMLYPAKEALTMDNTPEFTWQSSVNAVSYEIQIATSSTFSATSLIKDQAGITGLTYTSSALPDGRYYWRVRGLNAYNAYGKWSAYRAFTVDTTAPLPPNLYKPLTAATAIGTPTFTWVKSSTAVYYQFEYGTSTDYNSYLYRSGDTTSLSHKPPIMAPKVTYYWFARARDKAGNWSAWSAPFTITIEPTVPLRPTLNTPLNGEFKNDNTPELTWKAVDYGANYHVQVSKSSSFSILVPKDVDQEGVSALSYTVSTLTDGKYYWRVRARNVNGAYGSWSSIRYFTVDTIAPPAPVQVLPEDVSTKIGTPTFSWKASPTASKYLFAYNTSGSTSSFSYTSALLTTLSHRPPTMAAKTQYYWFVRAVDKAGNQSGWSGPFLVYIEPTVPTRVSLSLPYSGAKSTSATVTLAWKAVTYGDIYQIQIDNSSGFGSVDYTYDSAAGATSRDVGPLPAGRWYWRVSARNLNSVNGPWSSYRYFTVAP